MAIYSHKIITTLPAFMFLIGFVASDFAQDKQQCGNKLINLYPCINFVIGNATVPPVPCCSNLRADNDNSTKKCLCMLIKDRNEPGLGFSINVSLAFILPSICHAHVNISRCPILLNLAPNSTDAQVFKQPPSTTTVNSDSSSPVDGNRASSSSIMVQEIDGVGVVGKMVAAIALSFLMMTT